MKKNNDKEIEEITKNLEEQGLIRINPENSEEAGLTKKGFEEVFRWKEKNKEMDFLLWLFVEAKPRLMEFIKERGLS